MDGNISKISVNNNGYVSVILTGTTYKSVIAIFDEKGNELFKIYRSTTTVVDTSISNDNQYLAFAEINTSGTAIQSSVRVISIDKAKSNAEDYIIYEYSADGKMCIRDSTYPLLLFIIFSNCIFYILHKIDKRKEAKRTRLLYGNHNNFRHPFSNNISIFN